MNLCPSCALENQDDAAFCIRCGLALAAAAPHAPRTVPAAPAVEAIAPPPRAPSPTGHLGPGALVDGKYRIERVLGEGGMGVVFLARDVHTETHVVIKSIRADHAHDPDFRARTLAEGRALAHIDHPNVVRLNAVVVEQGALYLVMQFIDGESLDKSIERHVRTGTPVPLVEALRIFRMVVQGVGAAHHEGVIHRDIKPGNVLIRAKDGVAKVTDFGIAKAEEDAKAGRGRTQGIIGSLWYMAPEQVRGQRDLDKRVDVYALGILLFELLTGRVPFDAPSDYELMKLHTEAPLPSVHALRPDAPEWLDRVLARACAKNRDERYPSCEALLADFDALAGWAASTAPAPPSRLPSADDAPAPASAYAPPPAGIAYAPTDPARHGGVTQDGTSLPHEPLPQRSSRGVVAAAVVGLLLVGGGVAAYGWGSSHTGSQTPPIEPPPVPLRDAEARPDAHRRAQSPLAPLAGKWHSDTGRKYDAVLSGDDLEFRIVDASEFRRQDYRDGEARFSLRAIAGKAREFTVADKIRPEPPIGHDYDAVRSRGTCQEIWTKVGDTPLRAQFDGERLTVDMAKIEPKASNFQVEDGKVVGCVRLSEVKASTIESTYTRE